MPDFGAAARQYPIPKSMEEAIIAIHDLWLRLVQTNSARANYWEKSANALAGLRMELDFLGVEADRLRASVTGTDPRVEEFARAAAEWMQHHQGHAMCAGVAKNKELQELLDRAKGLALMSPHD